jgi:cytochrome c oxidase subunit IV
MADSHDSDRDDGHVHVHVHSWRFYAGILGALLVLTVITVAVSYVNIDGTIALGREVEGVGAWNLTVALLVATMKASLVVLFFMHLREDKRFNALIFVGSLLFIGVFFAYTMNDTKYRGQTGDVYNGVHVDPDTGQRAPGGITGRVPGQVLEEGLEVFGAPTSILVVEPEPEQEENIDRVPDAVQETDAPGGVPGDGDPADLSASGPSGLEDPSIADLTDDEDEGMAEEAAEAGEEGEVINDVLPDDADDLGSDEDPAEAP